jgi:hypothetical protein
VNDGVVDVPYSVSKNSLLDLLSLLSELDEVVDIFLEVVVEELL